MILLEGESKNVSFANLDEALSAAGHAVRLFGKPEVNGKRRMGVALALGTSIDEAREKARRAAGTVQGADGLIQTTAERSFAVVGDGLPGSFRGAGPLPQQKTVGWQAASARRGRRG